MLLSVVQSEKAFSQEARTTLSPGDSALATILGNAPERSRLRIHIRNGQRVGDPKPRLAHDSVVIQFHRSTATVALSEIDSVWVQRGTAALLLGAIAATPCAIYGALLGHFLGTDPDSNGHPGLALKETIGAGVVLGLICALPGATVGYWIKRWRLLYPAPVPRPSFDAR